MGGQYYITCQWRREKNQIKKIIYTPDWEEHSFYRIPGDTYPPKRAQQNIPCRQGKIIKRERIKSHHTTSERTDTFQPDASSHYRSELEENDIWSRGYNYFRCSSEAVQQRVKKSSQFQRRTVWRYKGLSSPSSSWAASGLGPNRRSVMLRVYTAAWLLGEAIYSSLVSNGKTAIYLLK